MGVKELCVHRLSSADIVIKYNISPDQDILRIPTFCPFCRYEMDITKFRAIFGDPHLILLL